MQKELSEDIVAHGRLLYSHDLVSGTSGNLSVRLDAHRLLITPSGSHKGFLKASDILLFDMDTDSAIGEDAKKPSSEIRMHTYVYQNRPDVYAVIHAHPPYTGALSLAGISFQKVVLPEVVLALGTIAECDYAIPASEEAVRVLAEPVQAGVNAFILSRHGSLTLGRDLQEAFSRLETVEHLAKIVAIAESLGEIDGLNPKEIKKLQRIAADHQNLK
jgi:L-fuculose-phosphate aldolase